MRTLILVLALSGLTASCAISPNRLPPEQIITEKTVKVLPPDEYWQYCTADYGDRSTQAIVDGLNALVNCERADKDALRVWAGSKPPKHKPPSRPVTAAEDAGDPL